MRAAIDCSTAISPKLAEGQTEGAVMNGISYAIFEEYLFDSRGRMTDATDGRLALVDPERAVLGEEGAGRREPGVKGVMGPSGISVLISG